MASHWLEPQSNSFPKNTWVMKSNGRGNHDQTTATLRWTSETKTHPTQNTVCSGVHYGTYRVEITHPTINIPAKYNTATTLGYETERGNPSTSFELKSR